jgi:trans-2-enoyl-CoA reductase
MKIFVVRACADGILAKSAKTDAKSAKVKSQTVAYIYCSLGALGAVLALFASI